MIYIQAIGLLAFCILVLSFYRKTKEMILTYQITANFCYGVHYLLLGGLTGAFISCINIFRNIVFIKKSKVIFVPIFIFLYFIVTYIFYEDIYSILPMVATTCYLVFMPYGSKKYLLIGEIMSASIWLIYSAFVFSYSGIITESILIVSNAIQLIKLKKR